MYTLRGPSVAVTDITLLTAMRILLITGFVVALLPALACGSQAAQGPVPTQSQGKEEQPQYGGTLVWGGVTPPSGNNMDFIVSSSSGGTKAAAPVYEALVSEDIFDPNYQSERKVRPLLAERWEISPDNRDYTFYLRKGIKWQDGKGELTSADVLYTYQRIIDLKAPQSDKLRGVAKMEAPDPYTVKLATKGPDADFLIGLVGGSMGIQPKHAQDAGLDLKTVAIGTGPFKVQSYDAKSKNVLVRNENYWQQGLPYLDRAELIWSQDKPSLLAAMIARQVDTTWRIEKSDMQTILSGAPDAQVIRAPHDFNTGAYLNIEHSVLKDPRVRQAIHLAVDRQEFLKVVGQGEGFITCFLPGARGWCLPELAQLPGFRQPKDQDIAEAKRLLKEAGYANGFEFSLSYTDQSTVSPAIAEFFATQMAPLGIKAKLDLRDRNGFAQLGQTGNYDAIINFLASPTIGTAPYNYFHSKGSDNKHGMSDPEVDRLLEQQAQTLDPGERKKVWFDLERKLFEHNWSINFIDPITYSVIQPWIKGPTVLNMDWSDGYAMRMATTWFDQKLMPKR